MLRYHFQFAVALLLSLSLPAKTTADEPTKSPNFVIFYVDDLGWADTSVRMPEKAKEMDKVLRQYVEKVDGGTMSDVYAAYFHWLDETRRKKEERLSRDLQDLKQQNPPDFDKQRRKLAADLQLVEREHLAKKAICKNQMTNTSWRETRKNEVVKQLGVDKQGNVIKVRP